MKIKPIKRGFTISSKFGPRVHPITGKVNSFHNGVDIPMYVGTPIIAQDIGTMVVSKANRGDPRTGYGYYAVVQYDGYSILYAHLNKMPMPVGSVFKQGDVIGYSGNSGSSTGPHLHMEVRTGKYDYNYFKRDSKGQYLNSVDPETFEPLNDMELWERILHNSLDSPEQWILYIQGEIAKGKVTGGVCQFFPQLIEKLGGKHGNTK